MNPTRSDGFALLTEFTSSERLIRHALAVEASMRAYAARLGGDQELWGLVGLIHDFDYERNPTPETHVHAGVAILKERGWPNEVIRAVASHADYMNVPRESMMEKVLYAVDELSGFIIASALIRPSRSIADLTVKSVRKRMKDKAFARAVDRQVLIEGARAIGVDLDDHIACVIEALKPVSSDLRV